MASDFTIIIQTRVRFGDEARDPHYTGDELGIDDDAFFAGTSAQFLFDCPRVDPSERAVLQFEHRGTTQFFEGKWEDTDSGEHGTGVSPEHPVSVNGVALLGGVPGAPFEHRIPLWAHRLLLIPEGLLKEEGNGMSIRSRNIFPRRWGKSRYDNFTIDNAVIFFKTHTVRPSTHPDPKDPDPVEGERQ